MFVFLEAILRPEQAISTKIIYMSHELQITHQKPVVYILETRSNDLDAAHKPLSQSNFEEDTGCSALYDYRKLKNVWKYLENQVRILYKVLSKTAEIFQN